MKTPAVEDGPQRLYGWVRFCRQESGNGKVVSATEKSKKQAKIERKKHRKRVVSMEALLGVFQVAARLPRVKTNQKWWRRQKMQKKR